MPPKSLPCEALVERSDRILVEVDTAPLQKTSAGPSHREPAAALKKLESYHWPGNVRELRNVLERALADAQRKEIHSEDLSSEAGQSGNTIKERAA